MSRTRRRPYPSDLSNAEWALLEPILASPERRGRPPKWPARRVADAVFSLLRSGCAWWMLPREYPPWQTVYYHWDDKMPDEVNCGGGNDIAFVSGPDHGSRNHQACEKVKTFKGMSEVSNPDDPAGS